jgi:ectoine hydroxylase
VIPGTHRLGHDSPNPPARDGADGGSRQPEGAIPLLVPPNSCVIFDRRLLHASSPNWSEHERKVIFYGFGYRWMRSKDVMDVGGAIQNGPADCPVIKQLLGWTHTNNGIFSPKAEDVPLREWMQKHGVLDEEVGIDTVNHGGPLASYADTGYPWQSHGDRPHSFNAVKRDGWE